MTTTQGDLAGNRASIRLWPGVVAAVILLVLRFGVKAAVPGFTGFSLGLLGAFAAAFVILAWWMVFSRARWSERFAAISVVLAAVALTLLLNHESLGLFWLFTYGIPTFSVAFVAWAAAARTATARARLAILVAIMLTLGGAWTLLRTEGVTGDHVLVFHWRWTASAEERLLAGPAPATPVSAAAHPAAAITAGAAAPAPAIDEQPEEPSATILAPAWPGFRGAGRDGIVSGVRIGTDWTTSPPVEIWRKPVGPGWSSFAVLGDLIYTQEQRGDDEVVAAYRLKNGEQVWAHRDATRFFEPMAGAGPRGTPTVSGGRVYTFGATGIVNALDAATGAVIWSRKAAAEAGVPTPNWGFASSPLVVNDLVILGVSGRLVAYDSRHGGPRWQGSARGGSFSSPQVFSIGGEDQVVLVSEFGAISVRPSDGSLLWEHVTPSFAIVQPALLDGGDMLIAAGGDMVAGIPTAAVQRVAVTRGPSGWTTKTRWTSDRFKPYFNDFVTHKGHVYGFDGRILACLDLADGDRKWKGGRYGNGQLFLLAEQDLLLVVSEEGELVLVSATPDEFREIARIPALEGKTWNHPVLVGDVLLVRNGEEMAAFRLPAAR
jgi:outer membrane protein assembly factor BamB